MATKQRSLAASTGGAVYVEFLIAFLPLFLFFMSLVQLAFVQAANLIVKHAATTAARAAIVILPDDPASYGGSEPGSVSGERRASIVRAARVPLAALTDGPDPTVDLADGVGRNDLVKVRLTFRYPCRVPGGALFVCGPSLHKKLEAEATLPNQGADYGYSPEEESP